MKEKEFIKSFIKSIRTGDLKTAKESVRDALMEKYESKKEKLNTEKN